MKKVIQIHEKDNVAVMLYDAKPGDLVEVGAYKILLSEEIPYGHKVALKELKKGDVVRKYNQPIGCMTKDVEAGAWVHIHNIRSMRGRAEK